ncbi:MAG TPA: MFS transporter [Pseudolysinimonas sp.]|nr:MFS transporter [Pseudolysinimonas sp.]
MTDNQKQTMPRRGPLSAWQLVLGLGAVSLTIDMVSDGSISVGGALLGQLGASAVLVGLVTGGAGAIALVLRLVTGPWVDRTGRYWDFTMAGYAVTAISIPLLALTPVLGGAALAVAAALILIERTGKAVRAPAKTVLLADAAGAVGRGKGFGVHKFLDQVGAFSGPLVVSAVAALTGVLWPAFLVLIVPAAIAMVILVMLRRRVPDTSIYAPESERRSTSPDRPIARGPARLLAGLSSMEPATRETFLLFGAFAALTTFGLISFGLISFHLDHAGLAPLAAIPLVYAVGMATAAIAAVVVGWAYDRSASAVLFVVPVLTAFVPSLALAGSTGLVIVGVVLWGAATGLQDSTIKALVADLIPSAQRGTAYGWFAVFQGVAAFAGAAVAGALYTDVPVLAALVIVAQGGAVVLLVVVCRRIRSAAARSAPPDSVPTTTS